MRKTKREELQELREIARAAAAGDEKALQSLYPQYGAITPETAKGLLMGLSTWLSNT